MSSYIVDLGTDRTRVLRIQPGSIVRDTAILEKQTRLNTDGIRDGVVANAQVAGAWIRSLLLRAYDKGIARVIADAYFSGLFFSPQGVILVPDSSTRLEQLGALEAIGFSGLARGKVLPNGVAIAHLLHRETALICTLGAGRSEVSVVAQGRVVFADQLVAWSGEKLDDRVVQEVEEKHNLEITSQTARQLKEQLFSLAGLHEKRSSFIAQGKDRETGAPSTVRVEVSICTPLIQEYVTELLSAAQRALEQTPAEHLMQIMEHGIVLTGGGSVLPGLAEELESKLRIPVRVTDDPTTAAIRGASAFVQSEHNGRP